MNQSSSNQQGKQISKINNAISIVKNVLRCGRNSFPVDLPEGYVRVYVGNDIPCKFELEAIYLNHPLFENLLQLSADEFGYSYSGALRIACDVDLFQHLWELLQSNNPLAHYMELHDLISKFYGDNGVLRGTQS